MTEIQIFFLILCANLYDERYASSDSLQVEWHYDTLYAKNPLFYKEMLSTLVDLPAEIALVNKGTCLFNNLFLTFPVPGDGMNTPDISGILTNGTITGEYAGMCRV